MANARRILVTGASGFVGSALLPVLTAGGFIVRRAVRHQQSRQPSAQEETIAIGDIDSTTDWTEALREVDSVVHLAARTHVLHETAADPRGAYYRINVDGTRRLAEQAAAAGVRRFVFLSSVKVNGERTYDRPFDEDDTPRPEDAYGTTKWEAEQALRKIERQSGLEVVILRPPLVYGPGAKGNFLRLMRIVSKGWPLPLATINNKRSMVFVGNLADAIVTCLKARAAAGRTYLISDGADVSTPQLLRGLAHCFGVAPRLFSFPPSLILLGATVLARRDEAARLLGSLQVDCARIKRELEWRPPYSREIALSETTRWFVENAHRELAGASDHR